MTRETKIGLLVGLAFTIVIGILLCDHFRMSQEPPQAPLVSVGSDVRDGVSAPGSQNPVVSVATPGDLTPSHTMPTQSELNPPASPVVVATPGSNAAVNSQTNSQLPPPAVSTVTDAQTALEQQANQQGQPLVRVNPDGTTSSDSSSIAIVPADNSNTSSAPAGFKQYTATDGDTVSRMAGRFMGANTRANRQAIIDANPSLQQDPDRVEVGKDYLIPTKTKNASQTASASTTDNAPAASLDAASNTANSNTSSRSRAVGVAYYTVKEGDSLWRIANDELDDPSAVDQIKALNRNVLKGSDHETVVPGMKLRLPAKAPVAMVAN